MPQQRPNPASDPTSPFYVAMLGASDEPDDRIADDSTAGRRGVTPQSPTSTPSSAPAGITGNRYDAAFMHRYGAQYPVEQDLSRNMSEYKRMTTPPPPASLANRIRSGLGTVLGTVLTGMGGGANALNAQATLRDRAAARKQQNLESLRTAIGADTRMLGTEEMANQRMQQQTAMQERGLNERAAMALQNQNAQEQRNRESIAGRADVAGIRNTGSMDRQDSEDTARLQRQQSEDASKMARLNRQGEMRQQLQGIIGGQRQQQITSQSRAMGEMASTVLEQVPTITSEIDALAPKLGPGAGRWNDLWVNKAGMNDPDFAGLDQDLDLFASALVRTHFGTRGGQQYRAELRKRFGEAQSPDDLKARIASADRWLEGYARMGGAKTPGGTALPQRTSDNQHGIIRDRNGRIVDIKP